MAIEFRIKSLGGFKVLQLMYIDAPGLLVYDPIAQGTQGSPFPKKPALQLHV